MTRYGVDYSAGRPSPAALRAAGYTFACRYLAAANPAKNPQKALTKAEADELRAGGIDLVSNWEISATAALKGHAQGVTDAQRAAAAHAACGGPADRPIYFSVDFDASAGDMLAVVAYVHGLTSVLGWGRVGVYGGYRVVSTLADGNACRWFWQTYAWSGGRWDPRAHIRQVRNGITVNGADCDRDEAHADDFGQWGYQEDDVSQATDNIIKAWSVGSQKGADGEDVEPVKWRVRDEQWQASVNAALADLKASAAKPVQVQVDATAVATALAGNAGFLKALAKAVNDDAAARLAD